MKRKVIILGGGLTGLSAALKLADSKKDFEITILEKNGYVGGLAASFSHGKERIPIFYHHVFNHDYVTQKYMQRFGLLDDMVWKRIKMSILANGKSYNFTDIFSLLSFGYLSFWGRIRYGLFGAYVFTIMNPDKIPDYLDAEVWLRKYAGSEVTEKLFSNLYARNKFNIPLNQISAKQFANRLKTKEALGVFGYPRKGLHEMIEGFESVIKKKKGRIIKNCNIEKVDLGAKAIHFEGKTENFDILINAIPIPEFLKIVQGISKQERDRWKRISYCPAVSIVAGFKELLGNHYWMNVFEEPVHVIMQHSWLFDGYKDKIVWIGRYGGSEEDLGLSDDAIKRKYFKTIRKYFPKARLIWTKIFKEKYGEPRYTKDYAKNKPDYTTSISGIYNAGVAVSYPKIRSMNTALISGEEVAQIILDKDG